jgi:hypothetical protein
MATIKRWAFVITVDDEDYDYAKERLESKLDGEDYAVLATIIDADRYDGSLKEND